MIKNTLKMLSDVKQWVRDKAEEGASFFSYDSSSKLSVRMRVHHQTFCAATAVPFKGAFSMRKA